MFWSSISCYKSQHSNRCSRKGLFLISVPVETYKITINLDGKFSNRNMGKKSLWSMPTLMIFESSFSCYGLLRHLSPAFDAPQNDFLRLLAQYLMDFLHLTTNLSSYRSAILGRKRCFIIIIVIMIIIIIIIIYSYIALFLIWSNSAVHWCHSRNNK